MWTRRLPDFLNCTQFVKVRSTFRESTQIDKHTVYVVSYVCSHTLEGNLMPMKPNASISESGRKYYLRDATLTNADIASHLTGSDLVNAGDDMGGQGQPPGTFWIGGNGRTWGRLVAVRTATDEVVVLCPFHSSLGQKMLAIGDFVADRA